MRTEKRKIGDFGEEIAVKFLVKHGHELIERNYSRKWGEIDIISKIDSILHFNEVKTVIVGSVVPRETDIWRPEENIHPWKLKRLSRAIQTYLLERNLDSEWQFNALVVLFNEADKKAKVRFIENIVL